MVTWQSYLRRRLTFIRGFSWVLDNSYTPFFFCLLLVLKDYYSFYFYYHTTSCALAQTYIYIYIYLFVLCACVYVVMRAYFETFSYLFVVCKSNEKNISNVSQSLGVVRSSFRYKWNMKSLDLIGRKLNGKFYCG